jgi:phage terminase large subunit GpA-like protein
VHPELRRIRQAVAARLRPKPALTVSQWADRYRHLSSLSSPEPGPWVTDRVPYDREILDCFHPDDPTEWIVFRTGTQVGKTEALLNVLLFYMHQFPRPIAYVLPNEQACNDVSEQRVDDAIKASPALRALVGGAATKDADGRKGKDSIQAKKFPGGMLFLLPATSKAALASKPCGVLLLDELNRFPRELEGEGSPVHIVEHRSQNFVERKIGLVSTPTDEGDSPICDWYAKTDQCVFDVPCPKCGAFQALNFRKSPDRLGGVVWREGQADRACYECAECGHWIEHHHKQEMLRHGRWRATATATLPRARGFHLSALYSPWVSWGKLAGKFLAAKNDPVLMRDFVTLDLAEAWRHGSGAVVDPDSLEQRAETGWGAGQRYEVPAWVQVLTSFVDVQEDRLEVSVWGWTVRNEGALIGHWILFGDPPTRGAAVWAECYAILSRRFRTPAGMLGISAGGIDTGSGSHWDAAAAFSKTYALQKRRQFLTKGLSSPQGENDPRPIWHQKIAKKKGTVHQVPINVSRAKRDLMLRLAKDDPPMIRFPRETTPAIAPEYYAQLCAEERVRTADATGRSVAKWRLKKGHDRNEALDCMVGAYAAFLGLDYRQLPLPCGDRGDLAPLVERTEITEPLRSIEPAAMMAATPKASAPKKPTSKSVGGDLWRRLRRN